MTKEFYEFLFNLRASGFVHHTRDQIKKIIYQTKMHSSQDFKLKIQPGGDISSTMLNGEVGSLGYQNTVNWRNMVICTANALNLISNELRADQEMSNALSDFYINKAETIRSAAEFEQIMEEMFVQFEALADNAHTVSYGRCVDCCMEYVNQQLYTHLTVEMVAEHMGYSPTYLTTLFKEKTGMTLYQYIQRSKIEEAKRMLIGSDQSVAAIASALCYHSLSHFSKAFKAAVGISPRQFRESGGE